MRNLCILLVAFFLTFEGQSQSPIDSLRKELAAVETGSKQEISIRTLLAKEYAESNPDTSLVITRSLLVNPAVGSNDSIKGQIFIAASTAWSYLASYDSSTFYSFEALEIAERYGDTLTIIDALNNLGIDYMFQEEDEKSIGYFKRVILFAKQIDDSLRWGHALNNLGMMEGFAENHEAELQYYDSAGLIFQNIRELDGLANVKLNSGTTYTSLEKYEKAEALYEEALSIFQQIGYTSGVQNSLQSSAENSMKAGDLAKANRLANEALEIAIANSFGQDIVYTYDLLEQIALKEGNYRLAYEYELKETEKKEELFSQEKSRQIGELETRYQTEKKEAEIARLGLENELKDANLARSRNAQLAIGIGGVMTIIGLLVFFVLRNKKMRAENEAQELQVEALKQRLTDLNAAPVRMDLDLQHLNGQLHNSLTEREFEILTLSMDGLTNSEIADKVFVSTSTIKFHLRNTYAKLGVSNRKEAIDYVVKSS